MKPEGADLPFRVPIEAIEDRIDVAIDAGHVDEADHGSAAPLDFHEAAPNHISSEVPMPGSERLRLKRAAVALRNSKRSASDRPQTSACHTT